MTLSSLLTKHFCCLQVNVQSDGSESDSEEGASGPPQGRFSQYQPGARGGSIASECVAPGGVRDANDPASSSGEEGSGSGEEYPGDGEEHPGDGEERPGDGEGEEGDMEEDSEGVMEEVSEGAGTRAQSAAQKSPSKCSYTPCEAEDSEEALKDCAACKELKVHRSCQCASVLYRAYNKRCMGGRPRPFPFETDAFHCGRSQA